MNDNKFAEIYRIQKLIGGKFVFIEDGEPKAVLLDYKEFQDLAVPSIAGKLAERISEIEDVNRQITKAQLKDMREEIVTPEEGILAGNTVSNFEENASDEIRIEPLDSFSQI